jgi:hypothetical protein
MKRLLLSLLFPLALFAQTPVTVQNPSFETTNTLNSNSGAGPYNYGPIPSWTITSGQAGSWQPATNAFPSIPDGTKVIWVEGPAQQDVGPIQSNGTYVLTASAGRRADTTVTDSSNWVLSLYVGSTLLCTKNGPNNAISVGGWQQETLSCPVTTQSGDLIVSLSETGTAATWDNVTLTFQSAAPPLPTETLGFNTGSSILYNDGTTLFSTDMQFNVTQLQNNAWVTIGNPTLSATGQLGGGNIVVDPNFVDANGFVQLRVQMTGIPMFGPVGFPQATFTHGSTGLTVSAVLFKSDLSVKSFHLDLTP